MPLGGGSLSGLGSTLFFWGIVMADRSSRKPGNHSETLPPLPIDVALWQRVAKAMRLSPQHARVVECVLRGLCDQQIADHLHIHKSTLRTYFDRISLRTGAHGRLAILRHVLTVSHQLNG
jgi:DNA-binding NarL/FixJ family response regulator